MGNGIKKSIHLDEDVWAILDAIASRLEMSRSKVVWHLAVYAGMCGGDFPLTRRVEGLAPIDRERVVAEVRKRAEADDPPKPQGFRSWVKEVLGELDEDAMDSAAKRLVQELIDGKE